MGNPFGRVELDEGGFTFKGFTGLRNNIPAARFDMTDLELARNIDLDDSGRARRREGFGGRILSGACHSIGPSGKARCFFASGTTLYELLADLTVRAMVTGITANRPVAYFNSATRYYWSNGVEKGCIENDANRSWGIDVPPRISATVGSGTLMVGRSDLTTARYQFTMTYLRNDDQESGAALAAFIDVPNSGAIQFDNLPVSADSTVDRKAIYISERNSEKMYRVLVLPNATTSAVYRNRGRMTLALATQFLGPPPAADIISLQGGSCLLGVGNKLYYSEPFAFELFDARKYKVMSSRINIICSFDNGTHVGTDTEHVWLAGDTPEAFEWNSRGNYGAIPGTLDVVDADASMFGKQNVAGPVGMWATTEGLVRGTPDGQLQNLTRAHFLYPIQPRGAGLVRLNNGMAQYVAVLQGTETAPKSFILP